MSLPVIVLAAVCLIAVWAVLSYNYFVHARITLRRSRSHLEAQLKLRHELVPSLSDVVREYAEHESDSMRATAAQRSRAIVAVRSAEVEAEENALAAEVAKLLAVANDNPRARADKRFAQLTLALSAAESELQKTLAEFNSHVDAYNVLARRFPMSLVAMWLTPRSFNNLRLDPVDFDVVLSHVGEFAA